MGGRQSTPGGSTGGFVPSSNNSPQDNSSDNQSSASSSPLYHNGTNRSRQQLASASGSDWRQRARSLTSVINASSSHNTSNGQPIVTVSPLGHASFGLSPPDNLNSIDDLTPFGRVFSAHSLPVHLAFNLKCPMCSKTVLPDDVECHLVMCLTKPRINYNEDILTEDKGECVICLDDLSKGNTIARLPCLCIYHKTCIDAWFEVNRSCPEHPSD